MAETHQLSNSFSLSIVMVHGSAAFADYNVDAEWALITNFYVFVININLIRMMVMNYEITQHIFTRC